MKIDLRKSIEEEISNGLDYRHAESVVAQNIILSKIGQSKLKDSITIKGGVVMFKKTHSLRRATMDIDFDLIMFPISDSGIDSVISILNTARDGITVKRIGDIKELKQEDYKGKRVIAE